MRRSLAPSQVQKRRELAASSGENGDGSSRGSRNDGSGDESGNIIIERQSFMGVLSIPAKDQKRYNVNTQFKLPEGCRVTKRSVELRKVKVMGSGWHKTPFLRPGSLGNCLVSYLLLVTRMGMRMRMASLCRRHLWRRRSV